MAELPGQALAQELITASQAEARATAMEDVIAAVRERGADGDLANRLVGRLWALERMFYYIYGGWGQGLEMNDFPPSVKYLFSKQIVDESTHEMLYMDALLRQGCVKTQKEAFRHPYGAFSVDSALAYYVFSLRNLATYPHPIRIAALNLGPKIVEFAWMEALAEAAADPGLKRTFASQRVENQSHIKWGGASSRNSSKSRSSSICAAGPAASPARITDASCMSSAISCCSAKPRRRRSSACG